LSSRSTAAPLRSRDQRERCLVNSNARQDTRLIERVLQSLGDGTGHVEQSFQKPVIERGVGLERRIRSSTECCRERAAHVPHRHQQEFEFVVIESECFRHTIRVALARRDVVKPMTSASGGKIVAVLYCAAFARPRLRWVTREACWNHPNWPGVPDTAVMRRSRQTHAGVGAIRSDRLALGLQYH
jgi:hypothetical protein